VHAKIAFLKKEKRKEKTGSAKKYGKPKRI